MEFAPENDESYFDFVKRVASVRGESYAQARFLVSSEGLWKSRKGARNPAPEQKKEAVTPKKTSSVDPPLLTAILESGAVPRGTPLEEVAKIYRDLSSRVKDCKNEKKLGILKIRRDAVRDALEKYKVFLRDNLREIVDADIQRRVVACKRALNQARQQIVAMGRVSVETARTAQILFECDGTETRGSSGTSSRDRSRSRSRAPYDA